jgi:decaprenylphospho-beta-D-erythro-pentofuranosid-2-ulose 2-reductase
MKDALGSVQSVLVLGGTSDIALATVRLLVADRARLVVLAARDPAKLSETSDELRDAGAETVEAVAFDAQETSAHAELIDAVFDRPDDIDLAVVAFGVLGDQEELLADPGAAADTVNVNFTGATSALLAVADRMRRQGHGTIVVLSSVAGERARRSNFIYGSAKAGLDAFAQGLADELHPSGVEVIVVRPGMVRTKMTEGMKEAPFTVTPERVAEDIVAAVRRGGSQTVWSPPVLRYVMAVLRLVPRPLFRRLDL